MTHLLLNYPWIPSILFFSGAILLLVCAGLVFFHNKRSLQKTQAAGRRGEAAVQETLDRFGCMDRLDNAVVGDINNPKSMAEIDHIVRCPGKLLVVEGKSWTGEIRGGVDDEFWTLTTRKGDVWKRRNPLWQADRQRRILSYVTKGVPVESLVIILGRNEFPDGVPEGVLTYHTVPSLRRIFHDMPQSGPTPGQIDKVWTEIVEEHYSEFGNKREKAYMEYLFHRKQLFPLWARMLCLGISFSVIAILSTIFFGYHM